MANKNVREFDIQPHISMLPKVGQLDYRLDQALSELIDNILDAAGEDRVEVQVAYRPEMIVVEDPIGMSDTDLESALRLGQSNKKCAERGGFGIGFKAAAMSLGKDFIIITARRQDKFATHVAFVMDEFLARGRWTLHSRRVDKPFVHGTRIEISNLNAAYSPVAERRLRERLALIFKRFLKSGQLVLTVNGERPEVEEPDINDSTRREMVLSVFGHVARGWVAQQVNRRKTQSPFGFDLLRRNRVISAHDHVGLSQHAGICGVFVGEIDLDFVPVTFNKNAFRKESPEWVEFDAQLKQFMKPFIRERQRLYPSRDPKDRSDDAAVKQAIEAASAQGIDRQRHSGYKKNHTMEERHDVPVSGLAVDICSALRTILGDVDLRHEFKRLGEHHKSYTVFRSSVNGGAVTITTNIDAPLYRCYPQPDVWATVHINEATQAVLDEIAGRKRPPNHVLDHLERVLGKSAMKAATA